MPLEHFAPYLAGACRPCMIRTTSPARDLDHYAPWSMSPHIWLEHFTRARSLSLRRLGHLFPYLAGAFRP
eukprot:4919971-Pyramimonas_sp.AAC.1